MKNPEQGAAVASDYLRLFALAVSGYMRAKMATVSVRTLKSDSLDGHVTGRDFYQAKLDTSRFFMRKLLPQSSSLFASIMTGSGVMMTFDNAAF